MKNIVWGKVQNAFVPAVTFTRLTLKSGYDDSLGLLGEYKGGFWTIQDKPSLPFLVQSFKGKYKN